MVWQQGSMFAVLVIKGQKKIGNVMIIPELYRSSAVTRL